MTSNKQICLQLLYISVGGAHFSPGHGCFSWAPFICGFPKQSLVMSFRRTSQVQSKNSHRHWFARSLSTNFKCHQRSRDQLVMAAGTPKFLFTHLKATRLWTGILFYWLGLASRLCRVVGITRIAKKRPEGCKKTVGMPTVTVNIPAQSITDGSLLVLRKECAEARGAYDALFFSESSENLAKYLRWIPVFEAKHWSARPKSEPQ